MTEVLSQIEQFYGHKAIDVTDELESEEYFGLNFKLAGRNIKFRKAKVTPKKLGHFVTLWTRNTEGKTEPFNECDDFDFCLIVAEEEDQFGFFLFPKHVLIEKQILTTEIKEVKRGFRVYPVWAKTTNTLAKKSQNWQTKYFINLRNIERNNLEKLNHLFARNN